MGAHSSERPTLPALHTLNLPNPTVIKPRLQRLNVSHDSSYENSSCPHLHIPQRRITHRHTSNSSNSSLSTSRTPSPQSFFDTRPNSPLTTPDNSPPTTPILSISPLSAQAPYKPSPYIPSVRFRLEPCALDEAQAIVLVPPPSAPFIPSLPTPNPPGESKKQALLLVGPLLQHFRHPQRQLAKGARIHPYRITPSQRRDSIQAPRLSRSMN